MKPQWQPPASFSDGSTIAEQIVFVFSFFAVGTACNHPMIEPIQQVVRLTSHLTAVQSNKAGLESIQDVVERTGVGERKQRVRLPHWWNGAQTRLPAIPVPVNKLQVLTHSVHTKKESHTVLARERKKHCGRGKSFM